MTPEIAELAELAELLDLLRVDNPRERAAAGQRAWALARRLAIGDGNPFATLLGVDRDPPPPADTPWTGIAPVTAGQPRHSRRFRGHTLTVRACPAVPGFPQRWTATVDSFPLLVSAPGGRETDICHPIFPTLRAAQDAAERHVLDGEADDASFANYQREQGILEGGTP